MAFIESTRETLVPQMTLDELPPRTSASEVSGFKLENVAASDGGASCTDMPFSSTKSLRRRAELDPRIPEWMSLRLWRAAVSDGPPREDRTKSALLLLRMSFARCAFAARVGLELEA